MPHYIPSPSTSSPLGLGTAAIGRPLYINLRQKPKKNMALKVFRQQGIKVLDTAYDQGIRYFDTAPGYGMAEELLLEWVKAKGDPDIQVATKWGYTYVANFDPEAIQHEIKEHSLAKLDEQWNHSRKLLPYLRTYQIHSATLESGVLDNTPVLEQLSQLKETHGVAIGLTSSGENQLETVQKALDIEYQGKPLFEVFQITYNILEQSIKEIIPLLKGRKLVIKEALANGRLLPNKAYPDYQGLYRTLSELAQKYRVGTDAIALRFAMDTLAPYKVLSGAALPEHVTDNLSATRFKLDKNETEELKTYQIPAKRYWTERKALAWN